jgi:DNA-binding protein H-NS
MGDLTKEFDELESRMEKNEKVEMCAIFNKLTGAFLGTVSGASENQLKDEHFLYKTIQLNPITETWDGDYATGKVISNSIAKPIIVEDFVDEKAGEDIVTDFQYHKQINTMATVMEQLLAGEITEKAKQDFFEVRNGIADILAKSKTQKQYYKESNDHEYITKEEWKKQGDDQLKGAIGEIVKGAEFKG